MKRNLIGTLSLVVTSLLFNVHGAHAQFLAQANVPFAFSAGGSQLPAGSYRITVEDPAGVIMIGNSTTRASILLLGQRDYAADKSQKLVFRHVGNRYFLTQIWGAPGSSGVRLQAPKPQRKLEIASKQSAAGKEVEIAAK